MNSSKHKTEEANAIIARMQSVRSSGRSHACELQGEAHRLFDWKEYVLTKPLVSVATVSVLGFTIVRSAMRAFAKPTAKSSALSREPMAYKSAKPSFSGGVVSLSASIASSAIKSYFANLVQRSISERGSSDRFHRFNSHDDIARKKQRT
jgi:hypothetical protein